MVGEMQAMVLAAGLGTRLRPLTDRTAKPAVPFLGVPVVTRIVRQLVRAGFDRVVVNLHHRADSVRRALAGLPVDFSEETDVLGTAGGPGWARARGLVRGDEPLLIVNGKIHTDIDFAAIHADHVTSSTAVSMVLVENRERMPFREVHVRDGRVVGFGADRSPEGSAPLAFTGIHVLSPEVVGQLPTRFADTVRDVYPGWMAAGRVGAQVVDGRWWELSTPERYLGLHLRARHLGLAERVSDAVVAPNATVTESVVWDDVHIGPDVRLRRCVVVSGARLPPGLEEDHAVLVPSSDGASVEPHRLEPAAVERAAGS